MFGVDFNFTDIQKQIAVADLLLNEKKETIGLIRLQRNYILLRLACFCIQTV